MWAPCRAYHPSLFLLSFVTSVLVLKHNSWISLIWNLSGRKRENETSFSQQKHEEDLWNHLSRPHSDSSASSIKVWGVRFIKYSVEKHEHVWMCAMGTVWSVSESFKCLHPEGGGLPAAEVFRPSQASLQEAFASHRWTAKPKQGEGKAICS